VRLPVDWLKGQVRAARSLGRWATLPVQIARRDPRAGVTILLYHRIGGGTHSDIDLEARRFDQQVRWLRETCAIASMDDVARLAREQGGEGGGRNVVAVTFDDGYLDTYEVAYPILKRWGVPATIYVPTSYVDEQRPFDFGAFQRAAPGRRPRSITWEQAAEMARSGLVTIGAHTHTHADLSVATAVRTLREVEECDRVIEARLGAPPRHFAYPWGRWSAEAEAIVAARYQTAVVGGPGKNAYGALNPGRLWRHPVLRTDGDRLFRARLRLLVPPERRSVPERSDSVA
jgi:peptidoglycan/xylan/chitin deacetylase (PgdA/CDA1 family)